tara:strand:- start:484 stop:867 length:384 start_codon:yes stop_codon:yes gene_type:complete
VKPNRHEWIHKSKSIGDYKMKVTKRELKKIIKEELEKVLTSESVKRYIYNPQVATSIPFSVLGPIMVKHPELATAAKNAANPQMQAQAFEDIAKLFADQIDTNSGIRLGDAMDVKGFIRYAEEQGML